MYLLNIINSGNNKSFENFLNIKDGILSGGIVYELKS